MRFYEFLNRHRAESLSEAEKGAKFERLMRVCLFVLLKYKGFIPKVGLWHDFPCRNYFSVGHVPGSDLVALSGDGEIGPH